MKPGPVPTGGDLDGRVVVVEGALVTARDVFNFESERGQHDSKEAAWQDAWAKNEPSSPS